MAENHDVKDIEANLKRMLNMNTGAQSPETESSSHDQKSSGDAAALKPGPQNVKSMPPQQSKKKKKGKNKEVFEREMKTKEANHDVEANNSALDFRGNEEGINLEDGVVKKNKNKKKKVSRKKVKDKTDGQKDDMREDSDSDNEDSVQATPSAASGGFQPKYLDDKVTPAIVKELEVEKIYPLKKKSLPFPKALYFCRLCDYHCDNVPVCRQHMNDARHRRRMEILIQDKRLKNLPTPTKAHYSALTSILEGIYKKVGLSDHEMKERETIAESLEEFLQGTIPELKLRIYGSSLTGFGLKSCDLNMDLVVPKAINPAIGLTLVYKALKQSDIYKEVRSNFQAKVPSVLFKSPCDKVNCEITIGSDLAYFTGRYLCLYSGLDDRLRKLAVVFRHWAKICELDDQSKGTLPAYCYDLMTIYFLQEIKPQVLPVLWKDLSEETLKRPKTHKDIYDMFEELKNEAWQPNNKDTLGMLWRDLVLFYGSKFDTPEIVVCIRSQKVVKRHEKKWKSRRIAIEDPFSQKRNVARAMHSTKVFDYFYNCLRKASLYFNMPTSTTASSNQQDKQNNKSGGNGNTQRDNRRSSGSTNEDQMERKDPGTEKSVNQETDSKGDLGPTSGDKDNLTDKVELCEVKEQHVGVECEGLVVTGSESDASIKPHLLMEKTTSDSAMEISDLEESVELMKLAVDGTDKNGTGKTETQAQDACDDKSEMNTEGLSSGQNSQGIGAEVKTVEGVNCDNVVDDRTNKSSTTDNVCVEIKDSSVSDEKSDKGKDVVDEPGSQETDCAETTVTDRPKNDSDQVDLSVDDGSELSNLNESQPSADSVTPVETEGLVHDHDPVVETVKVVITDTKSDIEESDKGSIGDTESDVEPETPDTSPLKAKRKKSTSPCQLSEDRYNFVFTTETLTDGKGPSIFCQICDKEGHHKNNCPEDQLPLLQELPPMTSEHLQCLSHAVEKVPRDFSLSKEEVRIRESVRKNVELHLLDEFPDCELKLFGSSINGFGFHHSDLDICVTFKNVEPQDLNFVQCIELIAKRLKSHRGLYQVFPITTAKVPIVKFIHRNSQLEGDISLYNVLALQNTKLLYTYASIDKRAMILGFAIKVFAKVCDIGDASKGSLSSYAYMLLMFHYLQHTRPPVIPVLQELGKEDTNDPEMMIDGWNAWFYDDLKTIPKIWPNYGKNKQSVGDLWLGFFRYYMEEFNIEEQVASIRQFEPLTKFEKLWNGKCIAIEDPFDLNHNLGGGLSRRMNQYILRTFIHARGLYGKPISDVPDGFATLEDYFFDREQLTEGKPPADRLCRVCSKIGHIAKECPRVLARKERDAAEKKRKEEMRLLQEKMNSPKEQNHQSNNNNHQKRASALRSKSDPVDYASPNKHINSQTYQRQYSETSDQRQMSKGPDGYRPSYNQPSSPQTPQGHPFRNRYPQSPNSPNPYSYKQQQHQQPMPYSYRTGHPSNLFTRSNPNECSNQQQMSHSANQGRHNGNNPANQNRDNRNMQNNLHKKRPSNQNRDYSSSPNSNAGYMNRGPQTEGQRQPQVSYVENGIASSRVGFTNPLLISPPVVYPTLGMQHYPFYTVFNPTNSHSMQPGNFPGNQGNSMTASGILAGNPISPSANYMGNPLVFRERSTGGPISTDSCHPLDPVPGYGSQVSCPVVVSMPELGPVYGQTDWQTTCQATRQANAIPLYQDNRPERKVNIQNKSGTLADVGITVKNDLFKGTE